MTLDDVLAVEHFADAVLRDDFFFRKGHWLSLLADRRVRLLAVRSRPEEEPAWSELMGVVVVYDDSTLHNLFLSKQWRGLGIGTMIVRSLSLSKIRVKTNMTAGDPTGFYRSLGFTRQVAVEGKKGQIVVLTPGSNSDVQNPSGETPDAS